MVILDLFTVFDFHQTGKFMLPDLKTVLCGYGKTRWVRHMDCGKRKAMKKSRRMEDLNPTILLIVTRSLLRVKQQRKILRGDDYG